MHQTTPISQRSYSWRTPGTGSSNEGLPVTGVDSFLLPSPPHPYLHHPPSGAQPSGWLYSQRWAPVLPDLMAAPPVATHGRWDVSAGPPPRNHPSRVPHFTGKNWKCKGEKDSIYPSMAFKILCLILNPFAVHTLMGDDDFL